MTFGSVAPRFVSRLGITVRFRSQVVRRLRGGGPGAAPSRSWGSGAISVLAGLILLLASGSEAPVFAQAGASSSVGGRVTQLGAEGSVAGAQIRLIHELTGAVASTLTDGEGRYRLPNLQPGGPYRLVVSRIGLADEMVEGIRLLSGDHLRVDVEMRTAAVEIEGIQVEARPGVGIYVGRMGVAHISDEAAIALHPTLGRDVLELAERSPLVHREGGRVSVAGQNDRLNAFQLDGLLLQDNSGFPRGDLPEARRKLLPLDAVAQFRVAASPFDVRESGFQGGLLQAVTRSGTNTWASNVFAMGRHEALLGPLDVDGVSVNTPDFRKALAGFSAGGPLRLDRTHIFVAGEFEEERRPPLGLNLGEGEVGRLRLIPDSVAEAARLVGEVFGADPGTASSHTLTTRMANTFARLDHHWSENRTLTVRHMGAWSEEDLSPNRGPLGPYGFSSAGTRWDRRSILTGVELSLRSQGGWGNLISVQHQANRESAHPASPLPQVDVRIWGTEGDLFLNRNIRMGGEASAHALELAQDLVELRNEVSKSLGAHHLALGGAFRHFRVRHLNLPGSLGRYDFDNLWDLRLNEPFTYEIMTTPEDLGDGVERFPVREWSLYAENEWRPTPDLTVRMGARLDRTSFPRLVDGNPLLVETLGLDNTSLPQSLTISPRVGVNWRGDVLGGLTQISGGVGVFQGRIPFEWIAATYAYTGTRRTHLLCQQDPRVNIRVAPPLEPGAPAPRDCVSEVFGRTVLPPSIQVLAPDLSPPRDVKAVLSLDRELPGDLTVTVEGLYSRSLSQLFVRDRNLPEPWIEPGDGQPLEGLGSRVRYGEVFTNLNRRAPEFGPVVEVSNQDRDRTLSLMTEVRGPVGDRATFEVGYRYAQGLALQTLTAADAISSFGRNPIAVAPNDPQRRPSPFVRPHTVTASVTASVPDRWGGTEVGLRYRGMSGRPFSFVYEGDANGDGFSGAGLGRENYNDLVYVPAGTSAAETPRTTPVARAVFSRFISQESCLREARGSILERGSCRGPWTNQVDLKLVRGWDSRVGRVEISGDLLNVLNMVQSSWGRFEDVASQLPILTFVEFPPEQVGGPPRHGLAFVGPVERDSAGEVRPLSPYTLDSVASRWQAQLGVRIRF